jgi:hypothetical protein
MRALPARWHGRPSPRSVRSHVTESDTGSVVPPRPFRVFTAVIRARFLKGPPHDARAFSSRNPDARGLRGLVGRRGRPAALQGRSSHRPDPDVPPPGGRDPLGFEGAAASQAPTDHGPRRRRSSLVGIFSGKRPSRLLKAQTRVIGDFFLRPCRPRLREASTDRVRHLRSSGTLCMCARAARHAPCLGGGSGGSGQMGGPGERAARPRAPRERA